LFVFVVLNVGIDTWVRLHTKMVMLLPKFKRTTIVCWKKFKTIFNACKEDKMANSIFGNNRQENKFYNALNEYYYQVGQVIKHIFATTTDNHKFPTNFIPNVKSASTSGTMSIPISKGKQIFTNRTIDIFEKMIDKN